VKKQKSVTMAELLAEAWRVDEVSPIVLVSQAFNLSWWKALASFAEGESIECVAPTRIAAKRMLLSCLRSLPSAKPAKKGRG
jgi:hypothetical protein